MPFQDAEAVKTTVAIDSLGGQMLRLHLRKRPGFEDEDVLEGAETEAGEEKAWADAIA